MDLNTEKLVEYAWVTRQDLTDYLLADYRTSIMPSLID